MRPHTLVSLVFIFRYSSTTTNPVCERRVNLLVCSLSLHRHSYIGFILAFASSIHNKQTNLRGVHTREEVCWLLLLWTAAILVASRARKRNLPPWPLVTHCTYGCQNSHERQLANSAFRLLNLYKRGSVVSDLTCSITPFHLLFAPLFWKSFLVFQKKSHFVKGARDSISRTSLFETVLMMCRSTSDLSLLVWMQFLPTYRITLTCHLALTRFPKEYFLLDCPDLVLSWFWLTFVYFESRKRELKTRPIYECRCDERLKTKSYWKQFFVVYYESRKRELKKRRKNEDRCDERLKPKV